MIRRSATTYALIPLLLQVGCEVAGSASDDASAVQIIHDTVYRVDTIVRVDTLHTIDTVFALGEPPASARAASPGRTAPGATERAPAASASRPSPGRTDPPVTPADLASLRARSLRLPVLGVQPSQLHDTFSEARGSRVHNALDIPAPRGTHVLSTDDGRVVKLHTSRGGGITIYAADPTERFVYYYAHLDAYRTGLREGDAVRRGELLGYVGTTGNAPPNVPHLHFAIARNDDVSQWWKGTPLDPRPIFLASARARD